MLSAFGLTVAVLSNCPDVDAVPWITTVQVVPLAPLKLPFRVLPVKLAEQACPLTLVVALTTLSPLRLLGTTSVKLAWLVKGTGLGPTLLTTNWYCTVLLRCTDSGVDWKVPEVPARWVLTMRRS